MAIREYSFKGWDLCRSLTLQSVTSNSAYRNRVCVYVTSIELTVRKTSPIYTKNVYNVYHKKQFLRKTAVTLFVNLKLFTQNVTFFIPIKKRKIFYYTSA